MVLFITRKFPPSRGGMERVAFELNRHLSGIIEVKLIKWGGSNKWLPLILPCLLFKSLWILVIANVQTIYLQDGLLAPLGLILKILTSKPVAITIHGLDITYENRLYQFVVPRCISRLDKVICISNATKKTCLDKGIPEEKTTIIPDGISDDFYIHGRRQNLKKKLSRQLKINLGDKKILLSVGRLVERKGIHWFVEKVMPKITDKDNGCIYLIVGEGKFSSHVQEAIAQNNLKDVIRMLSRVNDETLKVLYNASDIFVMPNVPVKGDMEGFGVVALEASSCALPVVASNLEGIRDAIHDGKNGLLVTPGRTEEFATKILELMGDDELRERVGSQAREFTLENYGWEKIARLYLDSLEKRSLLASAKQV